MAAAVSDSFSIILVVHSTDTSEDAASSLPAAGKLIMSAVPRSAEPKALTEFPLVSFAGYAGDTRPGSGLL